MRLKKRAELAFSIFFICLNLQALTEKQMNTIQKFTKTDYRTWDKTLAEGYLEQVQRGLKTAVRTAKASLKTYEKRLKKGLDFLDQQDKKMVTVTRKPETRDVATQTEPWLEQSLQDESLFKQPTPPELVLEPETKTPAQPLKKDLPKVPPYLEAEAHAAALELVTK